MTDPATMRRLEIARRKMAGETWPQLAAAYGVSLSRIRALGERGAQELARNDPLEQLPTKLRNALRLFDLDSPESIRHAMETRQRIPGVGAKGWLEVDAWLRSR